jgi:hypothetical protein
MKRLSFETQFKIEFLGYGPKKSLKKTLTSKAKHNRFCHTVRTQGGLKGLKTVYSTDE